MRTSAVDLGEMLGAERVLAPAGVLPQPALRLDASGPVRPFEFEVAVERLCLDSTSHRNLRAREHAEPSAMSKRILEIVSARGKMHNPETDSGGVLLGTVAAVGEHFTDPPEVGERVVTLGSLTLTPLHLDSVDALDPDSPQLEVTGTAYVFDRTAGLRCRRTSRWRRCWRPTTCAPPPRRSATWLRPRGRSACWGPDRREGSPLPRPATR